VDLNLDTLKREILDFLETAGFAVFYSSPGALDGLPLVVWDTERYPDYRMFLEVAQKCGTRLVLFAARELEASDLDDLAEQLEECECTREQQREFTSRLRDLRVYEGVTCTLEMAFDYNSRLYVYELQPDWYEEFLNLEDEITASLADEDEMNDDDSLGGYFSKN
jgi:hypothetical protein